MFKHMEISALIVILMEYFKGVQSSSLTKENHCILPWSPNTSVASSGVSNIIIMINLTVRKTARTCLSDVS